MDLTRLAAINDRIEATMKTLMFLIDEACEEVNKLNTDEVTDGPDLIEKLAEDGEDG